MRHIAIIFIIGLFSCGTKSQGDLLAGDLYFSDFRIGSFYNLEDSIKVRFENIIDTLELEHADSGLVKLIQAYESLKNEGLLYKPFVDLKTGDNSFVKLYMDSADYDRLKIHKREKLREEGKKVIVKARVREITDIGYPLFYCEDLVGIVLVDGETLLGRSKLRIEDYN